VLDSLIFLAGVSHGDDKALNAVRAIKDAVDQGRRVKIKSVDGLDVTDQAFTRPSNGGRRRTQDVVEDITIGIARRESDRSIESSEAPSEKARPAVIVTEDRQMRVKANGLRVAAMASSFLTKLITNARRRSISREISSS
jgi:hypothetical protein